MDPFSRYITEEIAPIAQEEDNQKCFQCQASPANWICVFNGIFLCASCAGEHRGFGGRISCIKSLILDVINPFQIETMKVGGNKRAKTLLSSNWKDYKAYERIVVFSSKLMEYHRNYLYDTIVGNELQPPVDSNEVMERMEKDSIIQRPILREVPKKIIREEKEEVEQEEIEDVEDETTTQTKEPKEIDTNVKDEDINIDNSKGENRQEGKPEENATEKQETKQMQKEPDQLKGETIKATPPKDDQKKNKSRVSEGKTKEVSDCAFQ